MATGTIKSSNRQRVVVPSNSNITLTVTSDWNINFIILGNGTIQSNNNIFFVVQGYVTASRCYVANLTSVSASIFEVDNSDASGKSFIIRNKGTGDIRLLIYNLEPESQSITIS